MIERYARPRMKAVWTERSKYDKWLQVELAVCEAWADQGVIPAEDMRKLQSVSYDYERLTQILETHRHEMIAFLQSITERAGPEGRWLHLGLTTSDVWDTATSLQVLDAIALLDEGIEALISAIGERALEHRHTLMVGRTHGVHAEPVTFGLKLAVWYDEMRRNRTRLAQAREVMAFGKFSGPVGTHATVPPSVEAQVCAKLGLKAAPASNQILQRDRHAQYVTTLALIAASLEKFATEIRGLQRTEVREVAESFPKGQPGSSSMPHKRKPGALGARMWPRPPHTRPRSDRAGKRCAVARAGHQPLLGGADRAAGTPPWRSTTSWTSSPASSGGSGSILNE